MAGASRIFAVDINPDKFRVATALGATDTVNSAALDKPVQQHIAGDLTKWGVDYSFDCTGNTNVMRAALECAHRGWVRRFPFNESASRVCLLFSNHPDPPFVFIFFVPSSLQPAGYVLRDWSRRVRPRDLDTALSACYWSCLEGNRLWRVQESYGCTEISRKTHRRRLAH
jgi:Zinc-binding dehydrogenase